jgi:Putative DNA-binding domain
MSPLALTQRDFQEFVMGNSAAIDAQIVGNRDFRQVRLGIYYDAYRLRLTEALSKDYEALCACLGTEAFNRMADKYLSAFPSTFRNLRWFGGRLADFLASDPAYRDEPVLAELARLEWAMGLAFDAPDDASLAFEDMATIAPEAWSELRFELHPSVQVLALRSNAVAIWHAVNDETGEEVAPRYEDAPTRYIVWRRELASYFRSCDAAEAWAIEAVREGKSFAEICAGLCEWVTEDAAPARVAGYLREWVDEGWIRAAISTP